MSRPTSPDGPNERGFVHREGIVPGSALLLVRGAGIGPVPAATEAQLTGAPGPLFTLTLLGQVADDPAADDQIMIGFCDLEILAGLYAQIGDAATAWAPEVRARWTHHLDQIALAARRSRQANPRGDWWANYGSPHA